MVLSNEFNWSSDVTPIYVGVGFYWTFYGNGPTDYDYDCIYTVTKLDNGDGFLRFEWGKGDSSEEYTIDDLIKYIETGVIKIKEDDSK